MTKFEVEFERNNVTPAQFLAYVRHMVDKKGGRYLRSDLDLAYFAAGKDLNFDTKHDGITEKSISKPYEMQTYIKYSESGCVYNEICEFVFDDDKTGHGYYYLVNICNETTETTEETTETTETTEETAQEGKNMALKTNSKKAKINIRNYVVNSFIAYDYTTFDNFTDTAKEIYRMFRQEYFDGAKPGWFKNEFDGFYSWTQGLSGGGVFDFWTYTEGNNPVDILGNILEETDAEKSRFTEETAADKLVYLIYREIKEEVKKYD